MAHIGRGVADDAGAPMTAAYGADGHAHQRAASAEGSESQGRPQLSVMDTYIRINHWVSHTIGQSHYIAK